ncbi:hypothetical protein BIW11_13612 [Tropilaelaps mercedesae]|uniref:Uncharacterized protein n=1 Tax=Tropilaelaps mercedesae TaxID=418985 RepID=A0A1V9X1J3_9ACAR|nr:hypothetical protein BIW11_13612 [Tropilaelaps mercedesae]
MISPPASLLFSHRFLLSNTAEKHSSVLARRRCIGDRKEASFVMELLPLLRLNVRHNFQTPKVAIGPVGQK